MSLHRFTYVPAPLQSVPAPPGRAAEEASAVMAETGTYGRKDVACKVPTVVPSRPETNSLVDIPPDLATIPTDWHELPSARPCGYPHCLLRLGGRLATGSAEAPRQGSPGSFSMSDSRTQSNASTWS